MMQRSTVRCPCCRRSNERAATNEGGAPAWEDMAVSPWSRSATTNGASTSGRRVAAPIRTGCAGSLRCQRMRGSASGARGPDPCREALPLVDARRSASGTKAIIARVASYERPDSAHADRVDGDRGCAASPTSTRALSIACAFGCAVVPPAMERRGSAQAR
jgi:hypothetical protein